MKDRLTKLLEEAISAEYPDTKFEVCVEAHRFNDSKAGSISTDYFTEYDVLICWLDWPRAHGMKMLMRRIENEQNLDFDFRFNHLLSSENSSRAYNMMRQEIENPADEPDEFVPDIKALKLIRSSFTDRNGIEYSGKRLSFGSSYTDRGSEMVMWYYRMVKAEDDAITEGLSQQ